MDWFTVSEGGVPGPEHEGGMVWGDAAAAVMEVAVERIDAIFRCSEPGREPTHGELAAGLAFALNSRMTKGRPDARWPDEVRSSPTPVFGLEAAGGDPEVLRRRRAQGLEDDGSLGAY